MTTTKNDVALDVALSLANGGKRLHIEYTVTNKTPAKILLWDAVVTTKDNQLVAVPSAVSTINADQPDTVLFVRGYVQPNSRVNIEYVPGLRPVEAGKSLKGSAEIDLPLSAWLAYGAVQPLRGKPTQALFELQYFPGDQPTVPMQLADGSTLPKPGPPWSNAVALRSEPKPIPTK